MKQTHLFLISKMASPKKTLIYSLFILMALAACKTNKQASTIASINLDTLTIDGNINKTYRASETIEHDLIHTKLEISFNWDSAWVYGIASIKAKPWFYPSNTITLNARGFTLYEVALLQKNEHKKLNYIYKNDELIITLDKNYTNKDTFELYINYLAKPNTLKLSGSEAIHSDKGLFFINNNGKDLEKPKQIWTQGETQSNSSWFPTIDRPNQKMTNEIFITVDNKYTTLSNGILAESVKKENNLRTDHWVMDLPHSPYLIMMAIGEFEITKDKWRNKEVSYYMEKKYAPFARTIFGNTPEMMEFFSKKLGVDYPWAKYAQVVVRDYVSGAMENTSATLHGESLNKTAREWIDQNHEDIIAHELFHQWFGDLVTTESWANTTLNEGFASYGEYLWIEYKYGKDEASKHIYEDQNTYFYANMGKQVSLIRYYYNDREEVFDANSYQKGACVLHMLRAYVGDDAFFAALKLYLTSNKFDNVELAQLRLAFEKTTGEDLNWFFNQWFLEPGHPKVEFIKSYNEQTHTLKITAKQKSKTTYRLPISIDIYTNDHVDRVQMEILENTQSFEYKINSKPLLVNIDPDKTMLWDVVEFKTNEELAYQYDHAPGYLNKREALEELGKTSDSLAAIVFDQSLNNSFWHIRLMGLRRIDKFINANNNTYYFNRLKSIAQTDPKSSVRAEAIYVLNQYFKTENIDTLLIQALTDSSYQVMSDAITALGTRNPISALSFSKKLETTDNSGVLFAIADIYANNGNDEQAPFFKELHKKSNGIKILGFLNIYGTFLKRCNSNTIENALPLVEEISNTDKSSWTKFYIEKLLLDLKEFCINKQKTVSNEAVRFKALEDKISLYYEKISK